MTVGCVGKVELKKDGMINIDSNVFIVKERSSPGSFQVNSSEIQMAITVNTILSITSTLIVKTGHFG